MHEDIPAEMVFGDFEAAGKAVLVFLQNRLGFNLWMVTRTEGDDWIILQSADRGYGVEPGTVFRWADSFCSEMVKGNGPRVAPNSELVAAYANAPIGQAIQINAYIGIPLMLDKDRLFGTLCAIHPSPQPESILEEQELLELLGAMLSTVLQTELKASIEQRRAEQLEAESLTDSLTQLYNRRGWDKLLAHEEERCRRYGHPAALVMIDLDDLKQINDRQGHAAGDSLITAAADALREAARASDIVARLGGDEFGILSVECNRQGALELQGRVRSLLAGAGVEASTGLAVREPVGGLAGAWQTADARMYADKRQRRNH